MIGTSDNRSETRDIAGLVDQVTVRSDRRGIPYLEAKSEDDLHVALGYVTARDRLWQMDLLRRTAYGELAELLGPSVVEQDAYFRVYGYQTRCERTLELQPPHIARMLRRYATGVNSFIRECTFGWPFGSRLPIEFRLLGRIPRPWHPKDSFAVAKVMAEGLSSSWSIDLLRASVAQLSPQRRTELLDDTSPLDVLLVGDDESAAPAPARRLAMGDEVLLNAKLSAHGSGRLRGFVDNLEATMKRVGLCPVNLRAASNGWVVSGAHTVSGSPILANDPHLSASVPSIWYLASLEAPGLRVAGATVPGIPVVLIGHNRRFAWGLTNLNGEEQDLYRETYSTAIPGRYKTPAGWQSEVSRAERILIRNANGSVSSVHRTVGSTRNGPIVFSDGTTRFALRWTALEPDASPLDGFYHINRAATRDQLERGMSLYTGPSMNCMWADVDGHVGYHAIGRIPVRAAGDGSVPYDGSTNEGQWTGFIPFEELPAVVDPPSGIIVTANNRVVGKSYRHFLSRSWEDPYRAHRILHLLRGRSGLRTEDMLRIQRDTFSYADDIFVAELLKTVKDGNEDPTLRGEITTRFDGWDAVARATSLQMPIAATMRQAFVQRVLTAVMGPSLAADYHWWPNRETFVDRLLENRPHDWLPEAFESYEQLFLRCFADGLERVEGRLGPDQSRWTWGRYASPIQFQHPLARLNASLAIAPIPQHTGGSGPTVNSGEWVSMRFVTDTADWDATRQGIALGQSGDPASRHWSDQLPEWVAAAPSNLPFESATIRDSTAVGMVLTPGEPATWTQNDVLVALERAALGSLWVRQMLATYLGVILTWNPVILTRVRLAEFALLAMLRPWGPGILPPPAAAQVGPGNLIGVVFRVLAPVLARILKGRGNNMIQPFSPFAFDAKAPLASMLAAKAAPHLVASAAPHLAAKAAPYLAAALAAKVPMASLLAAKAPAALAAKSPLASLLAAKAPAATLAAKAPLAAKTPLAVALAAKAPDLVLSTLAAKAAALGINVGDTGGGNLGVDTAPDFRNAAMTLLAETLDDDDLEGLTAGDFDSIVNKLATEAMNDEAITEALKEKLRAVVASHKNPEGDAAEV